MKHCNGCDAAKPLTEFHTDRRAKDGKTPRCKECNRQRSNAWRLANPEYFGTWRAGNRERELATQRAWQKANPERHRDNRRRAEHRRRARERGGVCETYSRVAIFDRWSGCAYCDGPAETLDHVTPVAKGGADAEWNLVPACVSCNSSKGAKTLADWAATF